MSTTTSRVVAVIDDIKKDMGCQECKEKTPCTLRLFPCGPRRFNPEISKGFCGKSPEELGEELEKHTVLCLNCRARVRAGLLVRDGWPRIKMQEVDYWCLGRVIPRRRR